MQARSAYIQMARMRWHLRKIFITPFNKKVLRLNLFKNKTAAQKIKPLSFGAGGAVIGAAFLMANSSIGPGFLTQTTVFTQQLLASLGFVILVSVLLDIGAQLNTWRVLTVSGLRAQDLSNQLLPGLGYFLSVIVVF